MTPLSCTSPIAKNPPQSLKWACWLAVGASCLGAGNSTADTFTWTGNSPFIIGIANDWGNPLNWQAGSIPVNDGTADVVMPDTPRDNPNLDQPWSVNSLTFQGPGNYAVGGDPLTIDDVTHDGTGTATFNNAVAVTGSDAVWRANSGPMTFNGQISGTNALVLRAPETITFDGATANTLSGSVTVAEGTLALSKSGTNGAIAGNLTISPANGVAGATVRWDASNQVGEALSSQVILRGSGLVDLNGFSETLSQLVLFEDGHVQSTGGTLTIDGQLVLGGDDSEVQLGAGNLHLSAAVSRGAAASGTVRIGAQVVTLGQSQNQFSVSDSPELVDFEINASITGSFPSAFLEKSSAGALRLTGASTYQGGTVITGGTLIVDNTTGSGTGTGTVTLQTATRLAGDGSTTSLVQMQNGATIGPSGSTGFPIGSLNIGGLSMNTASLFEVEFNHALPLASRRDVLTVAGSASIIGNLVLKNLNVGGTPSPSETYAILTAATLTGSFANVANGQRLTTSDGSGSFVVNYGASSAFTPNQVVLSAFQPGLTADFDEDDDVDGDDFTRWKTGYGMAIGATHTQGDSDADGDVDGRDFLTWQRQFGSGPTASSSSSVVPEPATGSAAWGFAAVAWLALRSRRI